MSVQSFTDVRATCFPYCLQKQQDGRYVLLNRRYKPLGFYTAEFVNYDDFPVALKIEGLSKQVIAKLDWRGEEKDGRIYLYNDSCNPITSSENMTAYLERLAILSKLQVIPFTFDS